MCAVMIAFAITMSVVINVLERIVSPDKHETFTEMRERSETAMLNDSDQ